VLSSLIGSCSFIINFVCVTKIFALIPATNSLAPPPVFHSSVKLIDDTMQMCEVSPDLLLDQTDFLVVGCIGLQGVGKSTVMSLIAGSEYDQLDK